MSVPQRYRKIGDFHQYYSGKRQAPVLTLVIGGNHEASNYFFELYHGGWLAPNIYYMGAANVIRYGPFRIAGLSGIYKSCDYHKARRERLPYDRNDIRSIYHVREYDIHKLLQVRTQVDIGISHDWPRGVDWFGDYEKLFAWKPHFLESAKVDKLGSLPAEQVMNHLRPAYWLSGHMHVKYAAIVEHKDHKGQGAIKDLPISDQLRAQLPASVFQVGSSKATRTATPTNIKNTVTEFLALDQVGPYRDFLELMEIKLCSDIGDELPKPYLQETVDGKYTLQYDPEWLAITRAFDEAIEIQKDGSSIVIPGKPYADCVSKI